jgi:hypothetical protein
MKPVRILMVVVLPARWALKAQDFLLHPRRSHRAHAPERLAKILNLDRGMSLERVIL